MLMLSKMKDVWRKVSENGKLRVENRDIEKTAADIEVPFHDLYNTVNGYDQRIKSVMDSVKTLSDETVLLHLFYAMMLVSEDSRPDNIVEWLQSLHQVTLAFAEGNEERGITTQVSEDLRGISFAAGRIVDDINRLGTRKQTIVTLLAARNKMMKAGESDFLLMAACVLQNPEPDNSLRPS